MRDNNILCFLNSLILYFSSYGVRHLAMKLFYHIFAFFCKW